MLPCGASHCSTCALRALDHSCSRESLVAALLAQQSQTTTAWCCACPSRPSSTRCALSHPAIKPFLLVSSRFVRRANVWRVCAGWSQSSSFFTAAGFCNQRSTFVGRAPGTSRGVGSHTRRLPGYRYARTCIKAFYYNRNWSSVSHQCALSHQSIKHTGWGG